MDTDTTTKSGQGVCLRGGGARRARGYALVALLAMMTVLALAVTAAAPVIRQQARRELELESIARGEEVAEAIRQYIRLRNGALPTSMDQLIEGVPVAVKKVQVLRATAARDPLSESGEWRLIRANDREFIDFMRTVVLYNGGRIPQTTDPALQPIVATLPQITGVIDTGSREKAPCDDDESASGDGPFIGVASRNRCDSVIAYYGIERRDKWVFTPLFK